MTAVQTIDFAGPVISTGTTAGDTTYTVRDGGTVILGGRTFTVIVQQSSRFDPSVYLTGPNGGRFLLRPYLGPDSGYRQIVSTKTGQELRIKGNVVRATLLGNIIEERT